MSEIVIDFFYMTLFIKRTDWSLSVLFYSYCLGIQTVCIIRIVVLILYHCFILVYRFFDVFGCYHTNHQTPSTVSGRNITRVNRSTSTDNFVRLVSRPVSVDQSKLPYQSIDVGNQCNTLTKISSCLVSVSTEQRLTYSTRNNTF